MKKLLELAATSAEQTHRHGHLTSRPLKGWRTVKQLRAELQFPSDAACRDWLRREGIPTVRRGRVILVDALDVDAALRKVS
jgi:hypothetical protein